MLNAKNLILPMAAVLLGLAACGTVSEPEGVNVEGMARIGEKLQKQGDDAGALDFYQRALQHKPDDVTALHNIATILENHGDVVSAETYNARAIKADPKNTEFQHTEGRLLLRLNRAADAAEIYQTILKNDHRDMKAMNGLGIAFDYQGQHEEAQNQYRAALERAPDHLVTLNNLAHSYVLSGKYSEAIGLLEPHAADRDATPALRQNLAEAYGLSGMYADAERMARMDLKPHDVKRNLAAYRARHAKLAPEEKLKADLGSYPTAEMADARAEVARSIITDNKITVAVMPEVQAIGGTPSFAVRATGFTTSGSLNGFCGQLANKQIGCKANKGK